MFPSHGRHDCVPHGIRDQATHVCWHCPSPSRDDEDGGLPPHDNPTADSRSWQRLPNLITCLRIMGFARSDCAGMAGATVLVGSPDVLACVDGMAGRLPGPSAGRRVTTRRPVGHGGRCPFHSSLLLAVAAMRPNVMAREVRWIAAAIASYLCSWLASWIKFRSLAQLPYVGRQGRLGRGGAGHRESAGRLGRMALSRRHAVRRHRESGSRGHHHGHFGEPCGRAIFLACATLGKSTVRWTPFSFRSDHAAPRIWKGNSSMVFAGIELGARVEAAEADLLAAIVRESMDRGDGGAEDAPHTPFVMPFAGGVAAYLEPVLR